MFLHYSNILITTVELKISQYIILNKQLKGFVMELQLNEPRKQNDLKEFLGNSNQKIPELISEGFLPMTVAQVMKQRLESSVFNHEYKGGASVFLNTADAIAYNPDGTGKMVMNSQIVRDINLQSKLKKGALDISDIYDSLAGEKLSKDDFAKFTNKILTQEEVLNNKIWNILAGEDKNLLNEYTRRAFSYSRPRFATEKRMGIFTSKLQRIPTLRLWSINDIVSGSTVLGSLNINNNFLLFCSIMGIRQEQKFAIYKEFKGNNIDMMPKLISEGFTPMTFSQIMERKLEAANSSDPVKKAWLFNYFNSADAIAYNPDGTGKIILNSQVVRDINPNSKLRNGALDISDIYNSLIGEKLSKEEFEKYATTGTLSKEKVLNNKVWNILSREDKTLLKEYTDMTFSTGYLSFGCEKMMGVFAPDFQDVPTLNLWSFVGIDYYAYVYGQNNFDVDNGRFVGMKTVQPDINKNTNCN